MPTTGVEGNLWLVAEVIDSFTKMEGLWFCDFL